MKNKSNLQHTDSEIIFYQEKFMRDCQDQLDKQSYRLQLGVEIDCLTVLERIQAADPGTRITIDDVLALVMTFLYFCKFGESPVTTAIFAPGKGGCDET